jgi:hypothetical protein
MVLPGYADTSPKIPESTTVGLNPFARTAGSPMQHGNPNEPEGGCTPKEPERVSPNEPERRPNPNEPKRGGGADMAHARMNPSAVKSKRLTPSFWSVAAR